MSDVEYEIIPAIDNGQNIAIDNSPTRLTIDPNAPSPATIAKMERSLEEMRMLRKMLTAAQRQSDPDGRKANRKKRNRSKDALAKASRKRNR